MTKRFVPTDNIRQLMADARRAFAADDDYAAIVGRAGAVIAARRAQLPEHEEAPEPPKPYECPDSTTTARRSASSVTAVDAGYVPELRPTRSLRAARRPLIGPRPVR